MPGEGEEFERGHQFRMTTSQAVGLGVLSFFVLGAIGLGVFGTVNQIRKPFERKISKTADNTYLNDALDSLKKQNDPEYLKTIDTDNDGLSDYDETAIYKSSQYLKDTNGDGIDDKESIAKGIDPTCIGGSCSTGITKDDGKPLDTVPASNQTQVLPEQAALNAQLEQLKKMTPAQIREQLAAKGVPKEKLDAIADDKLVELFQKSFEEALKTTPLPEFSKNTPAANPTDVLSSGLQVKNNPYDPSTMSIADIRKAMLATGKVTEEQLSKIDDTTLREFFLKTVQQIQEERPDLYK